MWSVWTLWTLLQEGATLCWAIWKCGLHRVTVVRRPGVYRPRCQQRDVKEFSFTILHASLQVVNRLLILLQPGWLEFNVLAEVTLALQTLPFQRCSCFLLLGSVASHSVQVESVHFKKSAKLKSSLPACVVFIGSSPKTWWPMWKL